MEPFWPTLPYIIPTTEGTPLWWYIFWWLWQIVVMVTIVVVLTRWATKMDKMKNEQAQQTVKSSGDSTTLNS